MNYKRQQLENFLKDLITPETESEKKLFKENGLVDDYIEIINSIPNMTDRELIAAINKELWPYDLEINKPND